MKFNDYQLKRKIAESDYFSVFNALSTNGEGPVIIKAVKEDRISLSLKNKLNHEFNIGQQLSGEQVIRYLHNGSDENNPFIVLEDFGAKSLATYLSEKKRLTIQEFLSLAKLITKALMEIHQAKVIHKDLNPQNILYNPDTQQLKIGDFGIASTLKKEVQREFAVNALEGTLEYLSPEQTGRMNREIDFRSDFYSLGVTFYEMLAGQRPFLEKDKLDLVHAHLALNPPDLMKINPEVPEYLNNIVKKLMAKNAEKRYQSARGLFKDLNKAEAAYNSGTTDSFELGEDDSSSHFNIPGKLYGREQEIGSLLEAFEKVCEGSREVVMVSGYSGVGKSALVKEIHKPVTGKKAYFIRGKYDQYQTNKPYYGMIEAYRKLIQQFLVEGDERIAEWKDIFLEAFGPNGQLMIDVIPELELIIGKQPPVTELVGDAAKTRFTLLFRNFIRALTSTGNPLVVFLDDLQWADNETINIIHDLLKLARNEESKKLFLIGAYRDNEVSEAHPLIIMLEQVKKYDVKIIDLKLLPIRKEDVQQMVIDTFNCNLEKAAELAEIVYKKTGGNPFFVNQFLTSLHLDGLVNFNTHTGEWDWDIQKITSRGYTDNIIDLMARKIEKLEPAAIEALKIASALGAQFSLDTLMLIVGQEKSYLIEELRKSVDAGLITQDSYSNEEVEIYEFLHDRIQQASYSFLGEDELLDLHYKIGTTLLAEYRKNERYELFDLVNHLNQAQSFFIEEADRLELAKLNYEAAQKAKNSNAYSTAREYLDIAIEMLPQESWSIDYDLSLGIISSAIEVAYLNKEYDKMDDLIEVIDKNGKELIDKIPSYEIKVQGYAAQSKLLEAIEEARRVLALIGIKLPKNPGQLQIMSSMIGTKLLTGRKKPSTLLEYKKMTDPLALAAMRILISTSSSAFLAMPNMFPLVVFNMVKLSYRKGISKYSSYGYACYGFIHCGVLGDIKLGTEYGKLALDLMEYFDAPELRAKTPFVYYAFIHQWRYPIRETKQYFLEGYKRALEIGDLEYGGWNVFHYCSYALFAGYPLEETEQHFVSMKIQAENLGMLQITHLIALWTPLVSTLRGSVSEEENLLHVDPENDQLLQSFQEINFTTAVYERYLSKGMCFYFFNDYEKAHEQLELARPLIDSVVGMEYASQYYFFAALTFAKLDPKKYPSAGSKLKKIIGRLKKIAQFAEENYRHKYHLAVAENHRINGRYFEAMDFYEKAADGASEYQFLNDSAIALECAVSMFIDLEKKDLAFTFWLKAKNAYQKWGAIAKVESMKKQERNLGFDELSMSFINQDSLSTQLISGRHSSSTSDPGGSNIDIETIIKASQSITGEIVLENLLNKLLKLLVQNAGAQSGHLLLPSKNGFKIRARILPGKTRENKNGNGKSTSSDDELAWSVVDYVKKTKETVILDNASESTLFKNDPFIQSAKPLSVLCVPFINQGKLQGIVYLSNNLIPEAFTGDRLALLKLLAGQIAISIENALFYDELEKRVQSRTNELQVEKKKSDDLLLNILPEQVAEELKQTGTSKARKYENVSVMFTDFKEFTKRSEKLSPEDLVEEIDGCFKKFDEIISKYNLEKIKTIGDAYMCVDGIPNNENTNPVNALKAAIEIRDFIKTEREKRQKEGKDFFEIRIGIHTGPVVAGIVGRKKFAFDIWGDAVNTAARMEQYSEAGKVNVSEATYQLIKDHFDCEYRGEIEAKNKGKLKMYFVE